MPFTFKLMANTTLPCSFFAGIHNALHYLGHVHNIDSNVSCKESKK